MMLIKPQLHTMNCLLLLFLVINTGCSAEERENSKVFDEKEVRDVSLFMSAESSLDIASPAWIKPEPEGFFLYDGGLQKIIKFDLDGNKLLSFGSEGRGPGEFQEISGSAFWKFDDFYLIYDRIGAKFITYDDKGTWIEDIPAETEGLPRLFPTAVKAVTPHQFLIPSDGKNGSLLSLVDVETERIQYFGNAVGNYADRSLYDPEEERHAISSGRIPARLKNSVIFSSNQSGIFSFQQTTAMLEKYSYSGDLIWDKKLEIPAQEGLFDHMFRENTDRMNRGLPAQYSFNYGNDIQANENGVAILLNVLDDQPVTVVWVPNNGESVTVVAFHGVENIQPFRVLRHFTISDDESFIFFVRGMDGEIYRAEWPL
jgi:hypothetical protein